MNSFHLLPDSASKVDCRMLKGVTGKHDLPGNIFPESTRCYRPLRQANSEARELLEAEALLAVLGLH